MTAAPSTTLLDDECIAFLAAILEPDDIIEFVTIPASSVRVWGSLESTLDAATKAGLWVDDEQIDDLRVTRGAIDREYPRLVVWWEEIAGVAA